MKTWQARLALLLIAAVILTVLCTVRATPYSGLIVMSAHRSHLLILWAADILLVLACIIGGTAAAVGFFMLIFWLCREARL